MPALANAAVHVGGSFTGIWWFDALVVVGLLAGAEEFFRRTYKVLAEIRDRGRARDDDWYGTPSRPGVPGRKGVMERLEVIEHEVTPNSSSSMKDAINRIEKKIDDHLVTSAADRNALWQAIADVAAMHSMPRPRRPLDDETGT